MLETKPRSVERAVRETTPRIAAHPTSASYAARAVPLPARPSSEAARRRVEMSPGQRLSRSESRLLTVAVTCTLLICGLLVLYLAAYAHVTTLGLTQSQARAELRRKSLDNEMLKAQAARLESPDRIAAAAARLGLTRDARRVDYIAPPAVTVPRTGTVTASRAWGASARRVADSLIFSPAAEQSEQGAGNGPTTDDNSAAHNH